MVIESSTETASTTSVKTNKVLATPVARKLAKDLGIDINTIKGTGIQGRVMKEDIYRAKEELDKGKTFEKPQAPKLTFTEDVERVKISKLRKTIAQNMALSKSIIPHATSMDEFDVTKLVAFRKTQKEMAEAKNIKLTFMPFIIKAVVLALKEYRIINSSFDEENEEIIFKNYYNIGIAVDTDDGLIVPVIKNADKLGVLEIAKELQNLTEQTRSRTVSLDKLQGGTFTITNYGAGGTSFGVPIIKYPEVAILGGLIQKKPIVVDNEIVISDILPISMSYDHRVIDGGDAKVFASLKRIFTRPNVAAFKLGGKDETV